MGTSPRRKLARAIFGGAVTLGVDGFFGTLCSGNDACQGKLEYNRWLAEVIHSLDKSPLTGLLSWPFPPGRGRLYVQLLDQASCPVVFAKVALDPAEEPALASEWAALHKIRAMPSSTVQAPAPLRLERFTDRLTLLTTALPTNSRPVSRSPDTYPRELIRTLLGPLSTIPLEETVSLSWWDYFCKHAPESQRLVEITLSQDPDAVLSIGAAHGDLSSANIVRAGDVLHVFDWEAYCEDAPRLTDEVGFYLAGHHRLARKDPASTHVNLATALQLLPRDRDLLLALAHRASLGMPDARAILSACTLT